MEGVMKRKEIPSFGNWEYYDEIPVHGYYYKKDVDLFKVPMPKSPLVYHYHNKQPTMEAEEKKQQYQYEQRRQRRACDSIQQHKKQRTFKAPKAVDEDLYKIPPEFLHRKPKKGMVVVVSDFWKRCLRLSCIP